MLEEIPSAISDTVLLGSNTAVNVVPMSVGNPYPNPINLSSLIPPAVVNAVI